MHLSQTLDSAWCRHEVDEARAYGIPIICVVDTDKQLQREVIDCYMEKGFGWLFDSQASWLFILFHLYLLSSALTQLVLKRSSRTVAKVESTPST